MMELNVRVDHPESETAVTFLHCDSKWALCCKKIYLNLNPASHKVDVDGKEDKSKKLSVKKDTCAYLFGYLIKNLGCGRSPRKTI